jgi:osmotically inducible protein OsmC
MKTLYTTKATSVSGREGHVETDDDVLNLDVAPPNSGKPGTNPEQLFACAYAACFGSAVQAVAKKMGIEPGEVQVEAEVSLNQDDEGFSIGVTLSATLPGTDAATAAKVVAGAHQMCPYSKATRNNVKVQLVANGQKTAGYLEGSGRKKNLDA